MSRGLPVFKLQVDSVVVVVLIYDITVLPTKSFFFCLILWNCMLLLAGVRRTEVACVQLLPRFLRWQTSVFGFPRHSSLEAVALITQSKEAEMFPPRHAVVWTRWYLLLSWCVLRSFRLLDLVLSANQHFILYLNINIYFSILARNLLSPWCVH